MGPHLLSAWVSPRGPASPQSADPAPLAGRASQASSKSGYRQHAAGAMIKFFLSGVPVLVPVRASPVPPGPLGVGGSIPSTAREEPRAMGGKRDPSLSSLRAWYVRERSHAFSLCLHRSQSDVSCRISHQLYRADGHRDGFTTSTILTSTLITSRRSVISSPVSASYWR